MDDITHVKPVGINAGGPAEPAPINEQNIESLDVLEPPKVRTKLRTYTLLVALYVYTSIPKNGRATVTNDISSSPFLSRH